MNTDAVTLPRAYATVTGQEAIYTAPDGHREHVTDVADIRKAVLRRATEDARRSGAALELVARGDQGDLRLRIDHNGTLTPIGPDGSEDARGDAEEEVPIIGSSDLPEHRTSSVPESGSPGISAEPRRTDIAGPSLDGVEVAPGAPGAATAVRASFIASTPPPAKTRGWRRVAESLGIRVSPSPYELARSDWVAAASRQWAGCRTIAVVNGKGGVGNVLAWDNNDTRGTLGWRTEAGLYDTTLRDLLPVANDLLSSTAAVSDIARFVHHQSTDRYDVLRSNPELLATDQRLDHAQFDLLMRVAARYYRLVVIDSGNDESAERWLRMVDSSQQLVIPTLATPESAESAALLLEALSARNEASAMLAANAVAVVTQAEVGNLRGVMSIADGFRDLVRGVEVVPFDRALKDGPLRFDSLRPSTRDAWLRVAASATQSL